MRHFESTTPRLNNKYWTSLQKLASANTLAYSCSPFSTKKTSFTSLTAERHPLRHQVPPGNKEIYSSLNKRSSLKIVMGRLSVVHLHVTIACFVKKIVSVLKAADLN